MRRTARRIRRRRRILAITGMLVILGAAALIFALAHKKEGEKPNPEGDEIQIPEGFVSEETISGDLLVDTPYGVLHFPGAFSDYTHVEIESTDKNYQVVFCCKYEEGNIPLFAVSFGEKEGNGLVVGRFMDSEGETGEIRIMLYDLPMETEWAKENAELLYSMQEAVNDTMKKIESSGEFLPADGSR